MGNDVVWEPCRDAGLKLMDNFPGQLGLQDNTSETNVISFIIAQALGLVRTGTPVKVVAVNGGGVGPAPTVDLLPLVNQMDGLGNSQPHDTVYGRPVVRNQGGLNAVINDPKVGDIGWLTSGDRDMRAVVSQADAANPSSFRRHSLSDGVYHPAVINTGTPDQYIQFMTNGLRIVDNVGNSIVMASGSITLPLDLLIFWPFSSRTRPWM